MLKRLTAALQTWKVKEPNSYNWEGPQVPGFPHSSVGKEFACNAGDITYAGLIPGSGEDPLENSTPVFLSGESHRQKSLEATVHELARVGHDLETKPPPQVNVSRKRAKNHILKKV